MREAAPRLALPSLTPGTLEDQEAGLLPPDPHSVLAGGCLVPASIGRTPLPTPPSTPTRPGFSERPFKNPRTAALWATFLGNVVSAWSLPASPAASPRANKKGVCVTEK